MAREQQDYAYNYTLDKNTELLIVRKIASRPKRRRMHDGH